MIYAFSVHNPTVEEQIPGILERVDKIESYMFLLQIDLKRKSDGL